ncbi:homeobox-leucine zipper protein HAT4 isoform X2 [Nicotiana tabacum]|uniref:Homeobox-leucine zipper protein HAT4 isoform X2 n=1 Tax=Nicotiana tabacum TaxID=4097 RepID=A0AC58RLA0_TOBAC
MGGEKEDGLGLSLSLGMSCPQNNLKNNDFISPSTPPFLLPFMHNHQISAERNEEAREFIRGEIDMNRPVRMIEACDEELEDEAVIMVSSPNNSTVSSVSGKRSHDREDNEGERPTSSLEDDGGDAAARKKLRLSKEQAAVLEETFKEHNTLNPKQKLALSKQLNLRPRQVEVWFQNRRARLAAELDNMNTAIGDTTGSSTTFSMEIFSAKNSLFQTSMPPEEIIYLHTRICILLVCRDQMILRMFGLTL